MRHHRTRHGGEDVAGHLGWTGQEERVELECFGHSSGGRTNVSNSSNEVRTWSAATTTDGLFTNSVYGKKVSAAPPAFMARSVLPSPIASMGRGRTRRRRTAAFPSCETSGDARSKPAYL